MSLNAGKAGSAAAVDRFQVASRISAFMPESGQAMRRIPTAVITLVHIAMTVFVLFLGFTQVYANVRVFGWSGFGTLLLISPVLSFAFMWFALTVHRARIMEKGIDSATDLEYRSPRRGSTIQP